MQLQKINADILSRLVDRFAELDVKHIGKLKIGVDVPSAEQVAEMQKVIEGTPNNLISAWKEMKVGLVLKDDEITPLQGVAKEAGDEGVNAVSGNKPPPIRLNACHDFQWSRDLWFAAAMNAGKVSGTLTVIYITLFYFLVCAPNHVEGVWAPYLISATLSTVRLQSFFLIWETFISATRLFLGGLW